MSKIITDPSDPPLCSVQLLDTIRTRTIWSCLNLADFSWICFGTQKLKLLNSFSDSPGDLNFSLLTAAYPLGKHSPFLGVWQSDLRVLGTVGYPPLISPLFFATELFHSCWWNTPSSNPNYNFENNMLGLVPEEDKNHVCFSKHVGWSVVLTASGVWFTVGLLILCFLCTCLGFIQCFVLCFSPWVFYSCTNTN